jgi:uncharacterized repeat protein (TIGR01451 family)
MTTSDIAASRISLRSLVAIVVVGLLAGAWLARPGAALADNHLSGFAVNAGSPSLTRFNTATNAFYDNPAGNLTAPGPIAITPNGDDAFVGNSEAISDCQGGAGFVITDMHTAGTFRAINLPQVADNCGVGNIAISPSQNPDGGWTVYASSGSVIYPIDSATDTPGAPFTLPAPSCSLCELISESVADLAISPNGDTLYVLEDETTEFFNDESTQVWIQPFDLTTPTPTAETRTALGLPQSDYGGSIAITPDGQTAVVTANACPDGTEACEFSEYWQVPLNPLPTPTVGVGNGTALNSVGQVTLSPDAQTAYISQLPAPVSFQARSCDTCSDTVDLGNDTYTQTNFNDKPTATAITPDGSELYTGFYAQSSILATPTGGGSDVSIPTNATGPVTAIAITPDQAPNAALAVHAGVAGSATILDASASTITCNEAQCSLIASYRWSFGDGSPDQTTATPTTTHVYSGPGPYTASVTETSSTGVSTTMLYNGHQMLIDGGPQAVATVTGFTLPTLATNASLGVRLGGSVTDTASLTAGEGLGGSVLFNLYAPDDPTCTGTPVHTDTVPVSGDGDYTTAPYTPTTVGIYNWTATYTDAASDPPQLGRCGDANESVTIDRAIVSIASAASGQVTIGGRVHDSARVSGGADPTGSVTFALYGPNDGSCVGAPVATHSIALNADGTATSPSVTPATAGAYVWSASYSGDLSNAPAVGGCGGAAESVIVAKATPQLTGSATASATLGSPVADTVTLTGGHHPRGSITFRLAAPGDGGCSTTPSFTSVLPATGDGAVGSGPFTPLGTGVYRWQASYSGDANNAPVTGPCGVADQSSTVIPGSTPPPPASTAPPALPQQSSRADLAVTLTGPAHATVGRTMSYTVTVTDHGPDAARSIVLTDALAGARARVTRVSGAGCHAASCTLAQLDPGRSVKVRLRGVPRARGLLTTTATARDSIDDPRPDNNRSSRTILATRPPADPARAAGGGDDPVAKRDRPRLS